MAHTNETGHLKLSQFTGKDRPSILTDYNSDMEKIDRGWSDNNDKALDAKAASDEAAKAANAATTKLEETSEKFDAKLEQVDSNTSRIEELETGAAAMEPRITQAEENIDTLESETNELDGRLDIAESQIKQNQVVIAKHGDRLDTAEQRLDANDVLDGQQTADIDTNRRKNEEQDTRLDSIDSLNAQEEGRLSDIEQKNTEQDHQLTDHEARITTNTQSIGSLNTSVDQINSTNETQDARLESLESLTSDHTSELEELQSAKTDHAMRLGNIEEKNSEQDASIDSLNSNMQQAQSDIARIDADLDAIDIEQQTQDDRLDSIEDTNNTQSTDIESLKTRADDHDSEIEELHNKDTSIEENVTANSEAIQSLNAKNTEQDSSIATNASAIEKLQKNDEAFETRLSTDENNISELQSKNAEQDLDIALKLDARNDVDNISREIRYITDEDYSQQLSMKAFLDGDRSSFENHHCYEAKVNVFAKDTESVYGGGVEISSSFSDPKKPHVVISPRASIRVESNDAGGGSISLDTANIDKTIDGYAGLYLSDSQAILHASKNYDGHHTAYSGLLAVSNDGSCVATSLYKENYIEYTDRYSGHTHPFITMNSDLSYDSSPLKPTRFIYQVRETEGETGGVFYTAENPAPMAVFTKDPDEWKWYVRNSCFYIGPILYGVGKEDIASADHITFGIMINNSYIRAVLSFEPMDFGNATVGSGFSICFFQVRGGINFRGQDDDAPSW